MSYLGSYCALGYRKRALPVLNGQGDKEVGSVLLLWQMLVDQPPR